MKMKMQLMVFLCATCFLPAANAQTLPNGDPRLDWHCVYPYTETNCQAILLAWSNDANVPYELIFDGYECSGCESYYHYDLYRNAHLLYAKCINRSGGKFSQHDLIAPIIRYKQSTGDAVGWNIVDWRFEKCFETWQCGEYCSLQTNPPTCLKYQPTNWGLYVPNVQGVCNYGTGASESPNKDASSPSSSSSTSEPTPRDTTWHPVY